MKNLRAVVIVISFLLFSSIAQAATPEEISKSYFDMLKQKQWTQIAKLYDPAALKDFREMMSFIMELPDEAAPEVLEAFFGPGATKASVKAISDADFFAAFLTGVMSQVAEVGQLDFKKVEVLGSVPEGKSLRHVVTRTEVSVGELSIEAMEVISFKNNGGKWGILLQGKMKGLAQQIRNALQSDEET